METLSPCSHCPSSFDLSFENVCARSCIKRATSSSACSTERLGSSTKPVWSAIHCERKSRTDDSENRGTSSSLSWLGALSDDASPKAIVDSGPFGPCSSPLCRTSPCFSEVAARSAVEIGLSLTSTVLILPFFPILELLAGRCRLLIIHRRSPDNERWLF